jgi:MFS family permease
VPQRRSIAIAVSLTWLLAAAIAAFTIENLWLDARLQARHHRLPSLVPSPQSNAWLAVFLILGALALLLLIFQILVLLNRELPAWKKSISAIATLVALTLFVWWTYVTATSHTKIPFPAKSAPRVTLPHQVTLQWNASSSPVAGYNIYRSTAPLGPFTKINSELLPNPSFIDHNVQSGATYYYVVRTIDRAGKESPDSVPISATIP